MSLRAQARRHGIATRHKGRAVPDETLQLILDRIGAGGAGQACYLPDWLRAAPAWGAFVQLYELRPAEGRPDWGIGDLADLAVLARALGAAGADFLGVNPMHALFLGDPERASPFSPSDRRFLNPVYVAPDALPGAAAAQAQAPDRASGDLVDYSAVVASKLAALRAIHEAQPFGEDGWSEDAFSGFVERGGESLRRYALFEALSLHHSREGHGAGWRGWPEAFQDFGSPEVRAFAEANADETRFCRGSNGSPRPSSTPRPRRRARRGCASALPRPRGGRVARRRRELGFGRNPVGAERRRAARHVRGRWAGLGPRGAEPAEARWRPDPVPRHDRRAAAPCGRPADRPRHGAAPAVPDSRGAARQGGRLRALPQRRHAERHREESQRHQAVVIGEDLGTVPEGFSEEMNDAGILSYRILYFEWDGRAFTPLDEWPETALACLSTHDLPTFADWWAGDDVGRRLEHGLVSEEDSAGFAKQRTQERRGLIKALRSEGLARRGWKAEGPAPEGLLAAVHRLLARTPSLLVAVRMSDLMGPTRPTNVPGTTDSYPNWRPRSSIAVDAVASVPDFRAVTAALAEARPRGPAR